MKSIDLLKQLLEQSDKVAAGFTTVGSIVAGMKGLEGEDFIVFNNGNFISFEISYGTKVVSAMLNNEELKRYTHFAKLGDQDFVFKTPYINTNTGIINFINIL